MTEINILDKQFKQFITEEEIIKNVNSIAEKINNDYENKNPIILCVLKGSFMFLSDLTKKLKINCSISFIQIKSYEDTKSSGVIKEVLGLKDDINHRDIIIVEDIVDTGLTYNFLLEYLSKYNPSSLRIATLFYKSSVYLKKFKNPPDYFAFDIPDKFIVGYGLDYNQYGRNYSQIYELVSDK